MKKSFILLSILSTLLLISCASVPKSVKPGDTLTIGDVSCVMVGYPNFEDVKTNGTFKEGIELTIYDAINKKEVKTVKTDKNGFFTITGLKPHITYCITRIKVTRVGSSGASYSNWADYSPENAISFIAYDNLVVNIGSRMFSFNDNSRSVLCSFMDYRQTEKLFKEQAAESEWLTKQIYQQ